MTGIEVPGRKHWVSTPALHSPTNPTIADNTLPFL